MTILDDFAQLLDNSIQIVSAFCATFEEISKDLLAVEAYLKKVPSSPTAVKIEKSLRRKCNTLIREGNPVAIRKVRKQFAHEYDLFFDFLPPQYKNALARKKLKHVTLHDLQALYDSILDSKREIKTELGSHKIANTTLIRHYCEKVRESCEPLLKKLRGLLNFIKKYSPAIIEAKTFTLNLSRKIRIPANAHVLIDTDFAKTLADEKSKKKQEFLNITIPGKIVIPRAVLKEMKYRPFHVGSALVPPVILKYFKETLHADFPDVNPTEDEKEEIVRLRRQYTPQGSSERLRRHVSFSVWLEERKGTNNYFIK